MKESSALNLQIIFKIKFVSVLFMPFMVLIIKRHAEPNPAVYLGTRGDRGDTFFVEIEGI